MMKKIKGSFLFLAAAFIGVFAFISTASAVESTWHGQFRINSYWQSASDDSKFDPATGSEDAQASRLRWRPTWDLKFDNGVAAHMQLNIGHINSNITNARLEQGGAPAVALRHAYVAGPLPVKGLILIAGLVPLKDKFGNTLFDSDWDFSPLTFALAGKIGDIDIRFGHANLSEGDEKRISPPADDVDAWVLDADLATGLGASFYQVNINDDRETQRYLGVRYAQAFGNVDFNAFAIYNWGKDREYSATVTEHKNTGYALKAEAKMPVGPAKVGVMGIYTTGDKNFGDTTKDKSDSFISIQSLAGTHGYWGYTGKLNVQGPTDTGIDDPVRIDGGSYNGTNLGRGLSTVQVNASFPIMDKLEGYAALGWFALNEQKDNFKDDLGTDLYVQGKYMFGSGLNLEFGVDYAALGKGHQDSVALGANLGESRNMTLVFSRLQLEF